MSLRILFAWELGANFGHLARDLPLALHLRAAGHVVFFALRDMCAGGELLARHDIPFCACPAPKHSARVAMPPASYAELLLADGFGDRGGLYGMTQSWFGLFGLFKPDCVVVDHAPTALLACRAARIPALPVGSGFEIPPQDAPMRSIRPWEFVPAVRLQQAEDLALQSVNSVLRRSGGVECRRLGNLFATAERALTTFPELDHYGGRRGESYVGPINRLGDFERVTWPEGDRKKILAYIRPNVAGFDALIQALQASRADVICVSPGLPQSQQQKFSAERLRVLGKPVAVDPLLERADLAIGQGGAGMVAQSLLAGVPMLLLPQNAEQYLAALRVEALGAGMVVREERTGATLAERIDHLLVSKVCHDPARNFSVKYGQFETNHAIEKVAGMIRNLSKSCSPRRSEDASDRMIENRR